MCTVTYLPLGKSGYILTSNRDESVVRKKAEPPRKFNLGKQSVFFPKDMEAGGTWIATAIGGFTLCLLNGANERHKRSPTYRLSRGLMLLDFFKFNNIERFVDDYVFDSIEPFTMIIVDDTGELKLFELKWNGLKPELNSLDQKQPMVWSSVTLYDEEVIQHRSLWFSEWLESTPQVNLESIMQFHEFGGTGNPQNDLVMNRNGKLFTVSITSIMKSEAGIYMKYKDLQATKQYNIRVM